MADLNQETLQFIIARLLKSAEETVTEQRQDPKDAFQQGKRLAYYEMLDILRSELEAHGQDLKAFGLDRKIENLA